MNKLLKGLLYAVCFFIIGFITMTILAFLGASVVFVPLIVVIPAAILFVFTHRNYFFKKHSDLSPTNDQTEEKPVQPNELR